MPHPILWVLVLNSDSARILCGLHRDGHCTAPTIEMTLDHKRLQDIMSDSPGRSFRSAGPGRSAIAYASDPVRDRETAFVREVVDHLEDQRGKGAFDELAIIASRPMLGMIRQAMPPALHRMVKAEIGKNLVHKAGSELSTVAAALVFSQPQE